MDFGQKSGNDLLTNVRYRIMDVYADRNGQWNQAASHTVVTSAWRSQKMAQPVNMPPQVKQQLMQTREAVWHASFANDQAALANLVPADTSMLENVQEKPFVRQAEILQLAKELAQSGVKLRSLKFPQTEMQVYGNTAIIYTTYLYELEDKQGKHHTSTGRAREIFVYRDGA